MLILNEISKSGKYFRANKCCLKQHISIKNKKINNKTIFYYPLESQGKLIIFLTFLYLLLSFVNSLQVNVY